MSENIQLLAFAATGLIVGLWVFGWRARPFFEATDAERERPETALGSDAADAAGPEAAGG